jgi:dihydroorotase-like cyclic amidohydrolase
MAQKAIEYGVYSRHILSLEQNKFVHGILIVNGRRISSIVEMGEDEVLAAENYPGLSIMNFENEYVCPGLIDLNACFNGDWEGYDHGTQAAVSGGTTFILETET